jgi:ABC-type bacteriocin/lantibiotic exporter with double-glycine peptidase domain
VSGVRQEELSLLRKFLLVVAIGFQFFALSIVTLMALAVFLVFVAIDGDLTPAKAFTANSLFQVIRRPFNEIPGVITNMLQVRWKKCVAGRFSLSPSSSYMLSFSLSYFV